MAAHSSNVEMVLVPVEQLRQFAYSIWRAVGLSEENARIIAEAIVQSELRTLPGQGQGMRQLRRYSQWSREGNVNLNAEPLVVRETPALAVVDAQNGYGRVMGAKAMRLAARKAQGMGIGAVAVRHSTHFGSAAFHAMQALDYGCIGIAMTNAGAEMAPWGGKSPVLGTNPWGIAIPTGGEYPVVLDIALTTSGKGMMRWYARVGRKMPTDWALTRDGRVTDDPEAAMDGTLLPIGRYKGTGLSLVTDILTGVLGGAAYGVTTFANPAFLDVGHLMLALHVEHFMPAEEFYARVQDFLGQVKGAERLDGVDEILVPGEVDYRRAAAKLERGVPIDPLIFDDLRRLADEWSVPFTLEPTGTVEVGREMTLSGGHPLDD